MQELRQGKAAAGAGGKRRGLLRRCVPMVRRQGLGEQDAGLRRALCAGTAQRRHVCRRDAGNARRKRPADSGAGAHPVLPAGPLSNYLAAQRERLRPAARQFRRGHDPRPAEHEQPHRAEDHRPPDEGGHAHHAPRPGGPAHRSRGRRAVVHRRPTRQKPHRRLRFFGQFAVRAHVSGAGLRRSTTDHRHHGQLSGQAGHDRDERQGQGILRCAGGGTP